MREIKFRAWLKGFWGGGEIYPAKMSEPFLITDITDWCGISKFKDFHLKDCVIMQFTGLLDKNGKEIYEGDILLTNQVHKHEIVFSHGSFKALEMAPMFSMRFGDFYLHDISDFQDKITSEVIGNVWENPNLLTDVKGEG